MQPHELLDRLELLFPLNSKVTDLRRSYIDKDLYSIFRLINDEDKEDLRKVILENNIWRLWPILEKYIDTQFVSAFKNFYVNNTRIDDSCFSRGQLESKLWLIKELQNLELNVGTVFLCAGWYATLATMLFESKIKVDKIRSFDLDPSCASIAETFNKKWFMDDWRFKASTVDIMDFKWSDSPAPSDGTIGNFYYDTNANDKIVQMKDNPNTFINTSCEHIENFKDWYAKIPDGKLVVLQSNNYFEIEEHINCYSSLEDFSNDTPMTVNLYEGKLELEKYTRFMKIGIK
jgi:hypothetical protein